MDPDKKQLIIMLGVVGILLVVVMALVFRSNTPSGSNSPQPSLNLREGGVVPPLSLRGGEEGLRENGAEVISHKSEVITLTPDQQDAAAVTSLARSFAELFGTYSNQGAPFSGTRMEDIATTAFQQWFKTAWPKLQASLKGASYHGLTTRAISVELKSHDPVGGKAVLVVQTQQEEAIGEKRTIQYRKLELQAVRDSSGWRVDQAVWQ